MNRDPVRVIIPADNAQDAIDETLRSGSQCYGALEIIVVADATGLQRSPDVTRTLTRASRQRETWPTFRASAPVWRGSP